MEFSNLNVDLGIIDKGSKTTVVFPFIGDKSEIVNISPSCFDSETEVLTDLGWKNWKDVSGKEKFLSVNPISGDISWEKAIRLINSPYQGKMIHLKNKNFDLMTTPDHKHCIKRYPKAKGIKLLSYDEFSGLKPACFVNIANGRWIGTNPETKTIGDLEVPFSCYCKFMGWYLSEGCAFNKKERKNLSVISISQQKVENKSEIDNLFIEFFNRSCHTNFNKHSIYVNREIGQFFIDFGHSHDKYVPDDIKNASPENINLFLESFIKGDGSIRFQNINDYPSIEKLYYTSSKKLVSDITEMLLKVNKRASVSVKKPIPTKFKNGIYTPKTEAYVIREGVSKTSSLKNITVKEIDYDSTIHSVTLERNNTLFIKRNGKITISGNCGCTAECTANDDCVTAVYTEDSKLGTNIRDQYPSGYYPFQKNITVYLKDDQDLQIESAAGIVYNPNKKSVRLSFTGKVKI